jgi:site-specific recombinase XerD
MPTVAALLENRRAMQDQERAAAPAWATITYGGERINLVFTNPLGGLVLRQAVAKVVKQAAKTAGITADLGTHTGRRTVVTTLFVDSDEALEDVAPFVGHARPAITAGYVKCLGRRPHAVAQRAAAILDGEDEGQADDDSGVRTHPDDFGSNGSGPTVAPPDGAGA